MDLVLVQLRVDSERQQMAGPYPAERALCHTTYGKSILLTDVESTPWFSKVWRWVFPLLARIRALAAAAMCHWRAFGSSRLAGLQGCGVFHAAPHAGTGAHKNERDYFGPHLFFSLVMTCSRGSATGMGDALPGSI